jgi:hypothetical protein
VLAILSDRIGVPDLVLALDSGSPTYDRLWVTTSLRGVLIGTLTVRVLDHGVHSGEAGGIVPSSFRIARLILDRIEDAATGDLLVPELHVEPPDWAFQAAQEQGAALDSAGDQRPFPTVEGLALDGSDSADRAMRNAWRASVAVVGADGMPVPAEAGSVLRPFTSLKLVVRIPPTCDADVAAKALARTLTADPPYGAQVTWSGAQQSGGWAAIPQAPWLTEALEVASRACFANPPSRLGEGGTIPFLGWLADRFPESQILAAGVLGPESNAHGPNEGLHLPTAERITAALAVLFDAHAANLAQ